MFVDLFLENTRLYKAEQLLSQRWCWLNIGILWQAHTYSVMYKQCLARSVVECYLLVALFSRDMRGWEAAELGGSASKQTCYPCSGCWCTSGGKHLVTTPQRDHLLLLVWLSSSACTGAGKGGWVGKGGGGGVVAIAVAAYQKGPAIFPGIAQQQCPYRGRTGGMSGGGGGCGCHNSGSYRKGHLFLLIWLSSSAFWGHEWSTLPNMAYGPLHSSSLHISGHRLNLIIRIFYTITVYRRTQISSYLI